MGEKQLVISVNNPDRYLQNCFRSAPLANAFEALAKYALKKESVLLVRSEHATIGISRPNERYWFYVSWNEGQPQIKFQHWTQSEPFRKTRLKQYKQACDEVAALYRCSPSEFYTGNRAKKNMVHPASSAVENIASSQAEHLRSCESCHLRRSEACSSLRGEVCEDYQDAVTIPEEEKELWPTEMLATRYTKQVGRQQEKALFRKKYR